jgi:hypothetical protein
MLDSYELEKRSLLQSQTALQVVWKSLEQNAEELSAQCLGFQEAGWLLKLTGCQN